MNISKIVLIIVGSLSLALLILFVIRIQKLDISIEKRSDNGSVITINNIEIDRNLSNGGKIKVKANQAIIDDTKESITLNECTLEYRREAKIDYIFASAKNCIYVEDKTISLKNNLKGNIDNAEILGTEKTVFTFYLEDGYGKADGGFTVKDDGNILKADKLEIFKESRVLDFYENVEVLYFID